MQQYKYSPAAFERLKEKYYEVRRNGDLIECRIRRVPKGVKLFTHEVVHILGRAQERVETIIAMVKYSELKVGGSDVYYDIQASYEGFTFLDVVLFGQAKHNDCNAINYIIEEAELLKDEVSLAESTVKPITSFLYEIMDEDDRGRAADFLEKWHTAIGMIRFNTIGRLLIVN